jgi:hypothetical protein
MSIHLTVIIAEGLDLDNYSGETVIDLKLNPEATTLLDVHTAITTSFSLAGTPDDIFYSFPNSSSSPMTLSSTFQDLGVADRDQILLDSVRRKRKSASLLNGTKLLEDNDADVIEVVCSTRLCDTEGLPLRKVRIITRPYQNVGTLMHDIGLLWKKSGLKFKCGRSVLVADKSYFEQGVENGAEIIITGGRG